MEHPVLEISGFILKKEFLSTIRFNVLEDTLVLENKKPFPGYFGNNLPDTEEPRSVFLVLQEAASPELVGRWIATVKKREKHTCYGNYAELIIGNEVFSSIRLLGLDCFSRIGELQGTLQKEGVKFRKVRPIEQEGLIKVHKTFLLQETEEGKYLDVKDNAKMYFTLSRFISWQDFEAITRQVKNNCRNPVFDAALGGLYRYRGYEDIVRIFSPHQREALMKELPGLYEVVMRHHYNS